MSSDEKDGDTHCGVFFFPCSERIDSESQSESRSVCFIVGSTITAYNTIRVLLLLTCSADGCSTCYRARVHIHSPPAKLDFQMKE